MLNNINDLLGKALGTCTLQRLLGRGGMGAVYLAQQSRPRRTVAVKVLLPDHVMEQHSRDEFLMRFRREADAIAALDHVNIMPIYEYGEQADIAYLVMPYVNGGTLRAILEKRGKLPPKEVLNIVEQVAAGLDSAHAKGIVHRDLKPGNILFHADGRVLIADFGLAKVLKEVTESESNGHFMTSTGTIVGTPEYLSPEQGTGAPLDHRTDVYSLGVVIYHMLAGHVPFSGTSPVSVAIKHALEKPTSLTKVDPSITAAVDAVVMKALAKSPDERYPSAGALAQALHDAIMTAPLEGLDQAATLADNQATSGAITPKIPVEQADTRVDSDTKKTADQRPETSTQYEQYEQDTPTEESLRVPNHQAIPTVLTSPDGTPASSNDMHNSDTEESPRLAANDDEESRPTVITNPRAAVAAEAKKPAPQLEIVREFQVATAPKKQVVQTQEQQPDQPHKPEPRGGCQSVSMMLIGSVLTLLVIVAGFEAYLHLMPSTTTAHNANSHQVSKRPTSKVTQTQLAVQSHPATGLPAPVTAVQGGAPTLGAPGNLLYSTSIPGGLCDHQGAQWKTNATAKINCNETGTELTYNSNIGQTTMPAGSFLTLPHQQAVPQNFVMQVQVTLSPTSSGHFGLYFRNPIDPAASFLYLISPTDNNSDDYKYANGELSPSPSTPYPLNAQLTGTVTLEVAVQGNDFDFYINGTWQGWAETGAAYTPSNVGLAADAGADVTFKNFALYSLN